MIGEVSGGPTMEAQMSHSGPFSEYFNAAGAGMHPFVPCCWFSRYNHVLTYILYLSAWRNAKYLRQTNSEEFVSRLAGYLIHEYVHVRQILIIFGWQLFNLISDMLGQTAIGMCNWAVKIGFLYKCMISKSVLLAQLNYHFIYIPCRISFCTLNRQVYLRA